MNENLPEETIARIAMHGAERCGDPDPAGIAYLRTTGDVAKRLLRQSEYFDEPDDSRGGVRWERAVVIKINGNLTSYRGGPSSEAASPTGEVMYLAFSDSPTPQYLGMILGRTEDLTSLERVGDVHVIRAAT